MGGAHERYDAWGYSAALAKMRKGKMGGKTKLGFLMYEGKSGILS